MTRRKHKKRKAKKSVHACPRCSDEFHSLKKFVDHIEAHDWSEHAASEADKKHQSIEAILLGLASASL
jgi:uncharacterized C2H2 Zn-finger protein